MKSRKSLLLTAVVAALAFPAASFAQDASKGHTGTMNHAGETSVAEHNGPEGSKTKAQVKKELKEAHQGGTHDMGDYASTVKSPPATAGKARTEVKKEVANMTPEEKKKLKESTVGAQ